jgi:hypothetical protein
MLMKTGLIAALPLALVVSAGQVLAQQADPAAQGQPKVVRPAPLTFAQRIKQMLQRVGATTDDARGTPDMVVSNYPDLKGGKTTIVIVNDRRKGLLGFYVYNFGSVKSATNKEEIYKYLLATNDAITLGAFFVDNEEDIGYKYLISSAQALNQATFEYTYTTMAAVARERKAEIKPLLAPAATKEDKPAEVKKAGADKPPQSI